MNPSNRILRLAERALQEQFTLDRLAKESRGLPAQSVSERDIDEALKAVLIPSSATSLVETVGQICVHIALAAGHYELAGRIHFDMVCALRERYDRQSLLWVVVHYQKARNYLPNTSPNYGRLQANKGVARMALAELGEEPQENLEQAVELYAQARRCFDPDSPTYGQAQLYEGAARVGLATLGVEPRENLALGGVALGTPEQEPCLAGSAR